MVNMKGLALILAILISPLVASGLLAQQFYIPLPTGNDNFYKDSFTIYAVFDEIPDYVNFTIDGEFLTSTVKVDDNNWSALVSTLTREGSSFTLGVVALKSVVNGTPIIFSTTKPPIKIDGILPDIDKADTNVNTAGISEAITVFINVTPQEQFLDYVTVGEESGSTYLNVTAPSQNVDIQTTPGELGCVAEAKCDLVAKAYDEAGNWEEFPFDMDVTLVPPSSIGIFIDIHSPLNAAFHSDSVIPLWVNVNVSGVNPAASNFCDFVLKDDEGHYANANPSVNSYNIGDFTGEQQALELKDLIKEVKKGSYNLTFSCRDSDEKEYSKSSEFVLLDTTPPKIFLEITEVSNSSVNISVNSSELFEIGLLEYKILGTDNATEIQVPEIFDSIFNLGISNLKSSTEYIIRVVGVDKEENEADAETEIFKTRGGDAFEDGDEKSKAQVTNTGVKRDENKDFIGQNYSKGIDWFLEGEETKILISNFDLIVRELIVKPTEKLRNVHIEIIASEQPPSTFENDTPDETNVYQYFVINAESAPADKIKHAKIKFEVSQIWLRDNNLDINSVALLRYDGEWKRLPTSLVKQGALLHEYEALSPGFSLFAVVGTVMPSQKVEESINEVEDEQKVEEEVKEETTKKKQASKWYLWLIGILIGVVILGLLFYGVKSSTTSKGTSEKKKMKDHKVVKTHMKKLEGFVDEALQKGHSKHELKEKLIKSGWDERLVEFVLRRR